MLTPRLTMELGDAGLSVSALLFRAMEEGEYRVLARALEVSEEEVRELMDTVNRLVDRLGVIVRNSRYGHSFLQCIVSYIYARVVHPQPRRELTSSLLKPE